MSKKLWNKDYVLLLQGNAVSCIGDLMYSVAIGYWVYEKTGSSGLMGVMSAISMFISMVASPFTGSVVDKCDRKWVMVGVDILQGVLMLAVGLMAWRGALRIPMVLAVAFLAAAGGVFYSPAVSTLMIDIIPHNDMVRGQSIYSGTMSVINLVGTAFSGVMVAFFGVPLIVVLNGLSNLYSAVSELFIHVPKTVQQGTPVSLKGVLQDTREAIGTVLGDPCLKLFVPFALIVNLLGAGPLALALPFCMERGFSVEQYGYLMSVWTAASVCCVVLLSIVKLPPKARFWVMSLGFSVSCFGMVAIFLARQFVPVCSFAFAAAFLNCAGNTIFNASLMLALPEKNRGAILGFIQSASVGGTALSTVIYGALGEVFPLYLVFASGSALALLPMAYLFFHPTTRQFILTHTE